MLAHNLFTLLGDHLLLSAKSISHNIYSCLMEVSAFLPFSKPAIRLAVRSALSICASKCITLPVEAQGLHPDAEVYSIPAPSLLTGFRVDRSS